MKKQIIGALLAASIFGAPQAVTAMAAPPTSTTRSTTNFQQENIPTYNVTPSQVQQGCGWVTYQTTDNGCTRVPNGNYPLQNSSGTLGYTANFVAPGGPYGMGITVTGYAKINGNYQYFNSLGVMQSNKFQRLPNGQLVYLQPRTGQAAIGTFTVNGTTYVTNSVGYIQTGNIQTSTVHSVKNSNGTYDLYSSQGNLLTSNSGWVNVDVKTGTLAPSGIQLGNTPQQTGYVAYNFNSKTGSLASGYVKINGAYQYFNPKTHIMQLDKFETLPNGEKVYLQPVTGQAAIGDFSVNGVKYNANSEGYAHQRLVSIRKNSNGTYNLYSTQGNLLTSNSGWVNVDVKTGTLAPSGIQLGNTPQQTGYVAYYFNSKEGTLATGQSWIDGHWQFFNPQGIMQLNKTITAYTPYARGHQQMHLNAYTGQGYFVPNTYVSVPEGLYIPPNGEPSIFAPGNITGYR